MVSNASDDLPEPDRPVMTTSLCRGMSTSIFLRLWTRAPRTEIHSCAMGIIDCSTRQRDSSAVCRLRRQLPGGAARIIAALMTTFHDFEQAGWERAAEFYGD